MVAVEAFAMDHDVSGTTAVRRHLRGQPCPGCRDARCGQRSRRCLQEASTSHDGIPFRYGSQLKDEERRCVEHLDPTGVNPPLYQGFEVLDARGADDLRSNPASAFAAQAAAAIAFTRDHGDLPPGVPELPCSRRRFSAFADNHRMPVSNGLRNVLRHPAVDTLAHQLGGARNGGADGHCFVTPLSERRNASIWRRSCALRPSGSSSLWPAGASGARL